MWKPRGELRGRITLSNAHRNFPFRVIKRNLFLAYGPLFVSPESFTKNPLENLAGTAFR